MQHFNLSLLATACAFALTACSSSGGSSSAPSQPKISKPSVIQTQQNKEEKPKTATPTVKEEPKAVPPVVKEEPKAVPPVVKEEPKVVPPVVKEEPKVVPPVVKEEPKAVPPVVKEEPKVEQPAKNIETEAEKIARIAQNQEEVKKGFLDNGTFEKKIQYYGTEAITGLPLLQEGSDSFLNVTGKLLTVENQKFTHSDVPKSNRELNQLIINGKTIDLFSAEEIKAHRRTSPTDYVINDLSDKGVQAGKVGSLPKSKLADDFAQMRYGYVTDGNKTTLFVQGHLTPENGTANTPYSHYFYATNTPQATKGEVLEGLPASGSYKYIGSAFYGKDNAYQQLKAEATADFTQKTVSVALKEGDVEKLSLQGEIKGNTFSGLYQGVETKGAFYGTKAQDMGGIFYQTTGEEKQGVFGATKQ
ncbi:hypothetical protein A4G19_07120 [Pasteurellaceae bacterium Macca]|nr:hypothetical protein [Pasteurellaceae bacterium Macca]